MPLRCAASRAERICEANSSARASGSGPAKRLAVDHFHDEVIRADVVERADVWVIERRHGTRFALEAGPRIGIVSEGCGKDLDRDGAIEADVPGLVHLAHPARCRSGQRLRTGRGVCRGQGPSAVGLYGRERGADRINS